MRREDKRRPKLAGPLRQSRAPLGGDYFGWFRLRTSGSYPRSAQGAVCHLEPTEDPDPPPSWFHEDYGGYLLQLTEAKARADKLAPGSLALCRFAVPRGYSYETYDGREYDVELDWDVCYAAPHPAFEEAWRRAGARNVAATLAHEERERAEAERRWRQPFLMLLCVTRHSGLSWNYAGDPCHREELCGYEAALHHGLELCPYGLGDWAPKGPLLAGGPKRPTAEEAIDALRARLAKDRPGFDLGKVTRCRDWQVR